MSENFETFLRFWIAENIRPLDRTKSGDLDEIVRSRAKELASAATTAGFTVSWMRLPILMAASKALCATNSNRQVNAASQTA